MAYRGGELPHDADDDESSNLKTKLHRQDAELCGSSAKGKGRNGEFTGESHASQLQQQERGNADLSFSNTGMAQSFTRDVESHVPTVLNTTSPTNIAATDHDLAPGFKGNADLPDTDYTNTNLGSQQLSKLEDLFISSSNKDDLDNGENDHQAGSSALAAGRSANLISTTRYCEACCNVKSTEDVGRAPCGHEYCRDCLRNLVETAITDESFFPPRCCHQPIPFEAIHKLLTFELAQAFINKKAEFDTQNRTYCSVQTCSAFIGSGNIADNVGTCQECNSTTCILCKAAAHDRGECPNDPTLQQVLDMVKKNGWQRCNSCSSVVELHYGCNHITCRCGAQFCYVCGLAWKACTCAQWDEHQLFDHANHQPYDHANLVEVRQPWTQRLRLRERFEWFRRMLRNLRYDDYDCRHPDWRYRNGPGICEVCGEDIIGFIIECRYCLIHLCRRCRDRR